MKKKLGIILGIILLISLFIGGKKYMDKKAVEKSYQDGIELIQNYVTDYLVKNYEGIEKIEWQGVGVEWRNSDIFGSSILGNYVNSKARIFVSEKDFFIIRFTLTEEAEYDDNSKKYVLKDYMNPTNLDSIIEMEIGNTTRQLKEKDKLVFKNIMKNSSGSPKAQVIYNTKIHELTY
ncbi:hypothetical protein BCR24_03970 [Enterococcus ureilyticus]|uniref:Uncharacterized protein n=1 Tax=Enterococcus ureilyticus TaxID=1131292 RepID=A0A1E5HBH7_9ENTE|nr:hypothetical protein [Enterococcus ureilyticus]MBO0445308.1 hypothetical protein [Enterococcus ureilyticus]OEG22297.1 hypothetical protein BCR24_03970 [Enterococcus ureilyticus]